MGDRTKPATAKSRKAVESVTILAAAHPSADATAQSVTNNVGTSAGQRQALADIAMTSGETAGKSKVGGGVGGRSQFSGGD